MDVQVFADLHTHTNFSDGMFPPIEVYQIVIESGIKAVSITDHDTVDGILALPKGLIEADLFLPGVEISAAEPELSCHILGYFHHTQLSKIEELLGHSKEARKSRLKEMIEKLRKNMGIELNIEELVMDSAPSQILGRPHLADLMIKKGLVRNRNTAFIKYLNQNSSVYVPYKKMTAKKAIEIIHEARGLSFIAHPGKDNVDNRIRYLVELGLDGIEVWHYAHRSSASEEYYLKQAIKYGLMTSGGSDFHAFNPIIPLGTKGVTKENYWKIKSKLVDLAK